MFFPERIVSIKETDRVLEVGPGGTPHPRSDVFLEKVFNDDDAKEQRGNTGELNTNKQVVYYENNLFPFQDNEFDYVICSHVLEHVPVNDFKFFIDELQRVAKKGYIEYPTIYYDFLYNFPKHITIVFYKDNVINYMSKTNSGINQFLNVQKFFRTTNRKQYTSLTDSLKKYYFQGFEWENSIKSKQVESLDDLLYTDAETLDIPIYSREKATLSRRIISKIRKLFKRIG